MRGTFLIVFQRRTGLGFVGGWLGLLSIWRAPALQSRKLFGGATYYLLDIRDRVTMDQLIRLRASVERRNKRRTLSVSYPARGATGCVLNNIMLENWTPPAARLFTDSNGRHK